MATDATGTPTSLGIPKFNVSVDNPSGLGGNAQMDAIDALFLKTPRSDAITGIAAGDAVIWNGTAWVKPSGTRDGTKFLRDDGSWQAVSVPTAGYGTTLPASPANGDEYILVDSTTLPTYQWRFRYNSGSSNTDKWELVGGSPGFVQVDAAEATASTTYAALTTAGPSFALPRAGVYRVAIGFKGTNGSATESQNMMSYDIGATGAVDANAASRNSNSGIGSAFTVSMERLLSGLTAVTLTAKYRANGGTSSVSFSNRWMRVIPVRVS